MSAIQSAAEVSFADTRPFRDGRARRSVTGSGEHLLHAGFGLVLSTPGCLLDGDPHQCPSHVLCRSTPQLQAILSILHWQRDDSTLAGAPAVAYAAPGIRSSRCRHGNAWRGSTTIRCTRSAEARHEWTTVNLLWRENATTFHARNPFPPAAWWRIPRPARPRPRLVPTCTYSTRCRAQRGFVVHQGSDLGRPSLLTVSVPNDYAKASRSVATAVEIDARN